MLKCQFITKSQVATLIPKRKRACYKGDFGHILLVGGNEAMGGAIQMATKAAVYGGSGLVTVASASVNRSSIHVTTPEAMFCDWTDTTQLSLLFNRANVIAIGSGFGRDRRRWQELRKLLQSSEKKQYIILDGDALTLYAEDLSNKQPLHLSENQQLILTPHIGEWDRLVQRHIDRDAVDQVQEWVNHQHVFLVSKGERTRLYIPNGQYYFENTVGNPGQAIGGMGDTLVGTLCSLLGQITPTVSALKAGIFLHSYIADQLYLNDYVVIPTRLSEALPKTMKQLSDYQENED